MGNKKALNIGSDRQLFVDEFWIDKSSRIKRELHSPVSQGIGIPGDKPWDKGNIWAATIINDDGKYKVWYRCDTEPETALTRSGNGTGYAESDDGLNWEKPNLGIFELNGSKDNNLVWMGPGANLAPFKDPNPDIPEDQRYKAVVRTSDLYALCSPDGINWKLMYDEPLMTDGPFDSPQVIFWDYWKDEYVLYARGVANIDPKNKGLSKEELKKIPEHEFRGGVRWIRRSTSKDFKEWSKLENIDAGQTPFEHLYTNAAMRYERAPGTYLMFPMRYFPQRTLDPEWEYSEGLSDVAFMSSRDGFHFDRSFMEAYIRPGLDKDNWHDRAVSVNQGMIFTSPSEISLYVNENMHLSTQAPRRYTLRTDGFVSVNAGYAGGEFITHPFIFDGKSMELNYSTSAVGTVKVEIQDENGLPIPGYTLDDCPEMFADEIDGKVVWKNERVVSGLSGKAVRLRFYLNDADIYSFKFNNDYAG